MTSLYALFIAALAFPSLLLVAIDSLFLSDIRRERVRLAKENGASESEQSKLMKRHEIINWARSLAPWLLLIFAVRAFVYEPFNVPSTSMMPQLRIGDEIVVEKFSYGVRDPLFQRKLFSTGLPERGDVAVFKNPEAPSLDYIKRVIGVPGDRIVYKNKQLFLEPKCMANTDCTGLQIISQSRSTNMTIDDDGTQLVLVNETLNNKTYTIAISVNKIDNRDDYFDQRNTQIGEFVVPPKHYFMMGDNRQNSRDSRFFGFVSEDALVGKPVLLALTITPRDEDNWLPAWIPQSISFSRAGTIR